MCFHNHALCWWEMKTFISLLGQPVNGWHEGTKTQQIMLIIFWWEQSFPKFQDAHTLGNMMRVLSVLYGQERKKIYYLFPVQQLHSSQATWIPLCFGYASACAPLYPNTHKDMFKDSLFCLYRGNIYLNVTPTSNLIKRCITSLSLDSLCMFPGWVGRSLYPVGLTTLSLDLSEKLSSGVGGKLWEPFL